MSEDEPTIQFSSGGPPDYVAIAAAISCMAGGRKKRRGGVNELKRPLGATSSSSEPAAKIQKEKGTNAFTSVSGPSVPPPPPPPPGVPRPVDPDTQKIADGLKMIDDGIRKKAGVVVEKNLWTIMGLTVASGAAACVAPQLALLPPIAAMMALYSPSLAASIRTPGGVTVSQLDSLVRSAKTKAAIEVEKQIATAKKDQKNQSEKLTGVLDRLSELTAKKDKIVALFDKLSKIADRASTVKKPDETIALIEETKAAVESAPKPEPAPPAPADPAAAASAMKISGGSRRRRASAPKRTRRSSSGRRRRYTRRR